MDGWPLAQFWRGGGQPSMGLKTEEATPLFPVVGLGRVIFPFPPLCLLEVSGLFVIQSGVFWGDKRETQAFETLFHLDSKHSHGSAFF